MRDHSPPSRHSAAVRLANGWSPTALNTLNRLFSQWPELAIANSYEKVPPNCVGPCGQPS